MDISAGIPADMDRPSTLPNRHWRLTTPVVGPLLADRRLSLVLALAGAAQVGLTLAHVGGIPCPCVALTGRPCPGCGLSRACAALCRGRWADAARLHAFAPCFVLAIVLFGIAAAMPNAVAVRCAATIAKAENRLPVPTLLLISLVLYWLGRLLYAPDQVARIANSGF